MKEIWKLIPNWDQYEVSNFGSVCRISGYTSHGNKWSRKILKTDRASGNLNRRAAVLHDGKRRKMYFVSQLVLLAFKGEAPEDKPYACHKDDNSLNDALPNLYWGSHEDNTKDAMRNDKNPKGENHGMAKLNYKQVEQIRKEYLEGYTQKSLADYYGVCLMNIRCILRGDTWGGSDLTSRGKRGSRCRPYREI